MEKEKWQKPEIVELDVQDTQIGGGLGADGFAQAES